MRKLNDKGYALVTVLLIAILLMGVAVMLLTLTNAGIKKNSARTDYVEAGELSDKGLEHITTLINKELQERIDSEMASGSIEGLLDEEFSELLNDVLSKYMCNPSDTTLGALETDDYDICISKIESSKNHPELSEVLKEVTFKSKGKTGDNAGREIETTVELGARELSEQSEGKPIDVVLALDISSSMHTYIGQKGNGAGGNVVYDEDKLWEESVEVRYVTHKSGKEIEVHPRELVYGDLNKTETIIAKSIPGYTLIGSNSQDIVITKEGQEIKFEYKYNGNVNDPELVLEYRQFKPIMPDRLLSDETYFNRTKREEMPLKYQVSIQGEEGSEIKIQPPRIPGFQLITLKDDFLYKFDKKKQVHVLEYELLEERIDYLRSAVSDFITTIKDSGASINIGIVNYGHEAYLGVPLKTAKNNKEKYYNELLDYVNGDLSKEKNQRSGRYDTNQFGGYYGQNIDGTTHIQSGFKLVTDMLLESKEENQLIMLMTDGDANQNFGSPVPAKKPWAFEINTNMYDNSKKYGDYRIVDFDYTETYDSYNWMQLGNGNVFSDSELSRFATISEAHLSYERLKKQNKNIDIFTVGMAIRKGTAAEMVMELSQTAGYYSADSGRINQVFDELAEEAITRANNLITDISPPVVIDRK